MNHRSQIANCKGQTPLAANAGTQWYTLKKPEDIPSFGVCPACYEDVVLSTPFGDHFEPSPINQLVDEL